MFNSHTSLLATLLIGALMVPATSLSAQVDRGDPIPLSQYARVEQAVAWAGLEVAWRRPVARGRVLFGELVPWDEVWTPSADSAAVFTTSSPVTIPGPRSRQGATRSG